MVTIECRAVKKMKGQKVINHHHMLQTHVMIENDNDSGYVTQNHESNSSLISETVNPLNETMSTTMSVYISEDALLEKPCIIYDERKSFNETDDEIIDASQTTDSTNYSGLQSCSSDVIKEISPIILREEGNVSNSTRNSFLNCSTDTSFNESNATEDSTMDLQLNNFIAQQNALKETLNKTPEKGQSSKINHSLSPDLFSEDDDVEELNVSDTQVNVIYKEAYVHKYDKLLLRKVQEALNGLLPPPSLKVVTFSVEELSNRLERHKDLFCNINSKSESETVKSALINCDLNEAKCVEFPEVLTKRCHGLQ